MAAGAHLVAMDANYCLNEWLKLAGAIRSWSLSCPAFECAIEYTGFGKAEEVGYFIDGETVFFKIGDGEFLSDILKYV